MKIKFLIVTAALSVALLGNTAVANTMYQYAGGVYTQVQTNSAADAAAFGSGMTGTLEFNIDTTGLSGTFSLFNPSVVTSVHLISGIIQHGLREWGELCHLDQWRDYGLAFLAGWGWRFLERPQFCFWSSEVAVPEARIC